jgi:hypothetical protein
MCLLQQVEQHFGQIDMWPTYIIRYLSRFLNPVLLENWLLSFMEKIFMYQLVVMTSIIFRKLNIFTTYILVGKDVGTRFICQNTIMSGSIS